MIRTRRWDSLALAALLLVALGVVFQSEMLVSFATIPIVFVAYGALLREPSLSIEIDRTLSPERPIPGDDVTVELTVTNTGERTVTDLRVVDGVPAELGVSGGSPRAGVLLRPGGSETLEYTITARRGEHAFEPVTLIAYSASGTVARRETHGVETVVVCQRPVEELPLLKDTSLLVGQMPTDSGGSGVEFYSLREHRAADARNRIDWRQFAKTGELTTVEYRQDRATSVKLLIDTRPTSFHSATETEPPAIEYCTYGAELCFDALLDSDHRVGVGFYPDDSAALQIDTGPQHEIEARLLFDEHDALTSLVGSRRDRGMVTHPFLTPGTRSRNVPEIHVNPSPETTGAIEMLLSELPSYAQVIMFSPLLDDEPTAVLNRLRAHGFMTMLISPDVTGGDSVGSRLSAHHRQIRIRMLRERNITVVDWDVNEPLSAVLERVL